MACLEGKSWAQINIDLIQNNLLSSTSAAVWLLGSYLASYAFSHLSTKSEIETQKSSTEGHYMDLWHSQRD